MPREPGKAAVLRAWCQRRSALPNDVRAVLAAAGLAAERTAAYLRLGILILIGLGLVGLGFLAGVYSDWIATIFALNLGVSIAAVVLARPAVFRSWVPLVMATLDAALLLGVNFRDVAERVSISYTPALAVSWAMFLMLALTAMRFRPALVIYLGGLLVADLATAMAVDANEAALVPTDAFGAALKPIFGAGPISLPSCSSSPRKRRPRAGDVRLALDPRLPRGRRFNSIGKRSKPRLPPASGSGSAPAFCSRLSHQPASRPRYGFRGALNVPLQAGRRRRTSRPILLRGELWLGQ